MNIRHLSASSIKTFKICQFAFLLSYGYHLRGFNNPGALKGTVTHNSVEEILLAKKNEEKDLRPDIKDIVARNFYIIQKEDNDVGLTEDDHDECVDYVNKIILDTNYGYFNKNIIGVEQKFDLCLDSIGKVVKENLSDMFAGQENSRELEAKFISELEEMAFRIFGFIDLIVEIDKDTIEIVDWKTSKKCLTPLEARTDAQLLIYDLVCRILFPDYKNRLVTLYYCKHKPITECFTDKDAGNTIRALTLKWIQINMCNVPQRTIKKADSFWKCTFCAFHSDSDNKFSERTKQCRANCDIFFKLHSAGEDMEPIVQCVKDKIDLREIYGA